MNDVLISPPGTCSFTWNTRDILEYLSTKSRLLFPQKSWETLWLSRCFFTLWCWFSTHISLRVGFNRCNPFLGKSKLHKVGESKPHKIPTNLHREDIWKNTSFPGYGFYTWYESIAVRQLQLNGLPATPLWSHSGTFSGHQFLALLSISSTGPVVKVHLFWGIYMHIWTWFQKAYIQQINKTKNINIR